MLDQTGKISTVLLESSSEHAREHVAQSPSDVIIASPYLTSDTAESVIGNADPKTAIILTTFRAKTFADGASSLQTLRNLITRGFQIRYLDGLHAKLILTSNTCIIGSQNLTVAGTFNKEATAIIKDTLTVADARKAFDSWLEQSLPITLEMIDEMKLLVDPLLEKANECESSAQAIGLHPVPQTPS
jgi:phosphatidylserine/phosphatidylglycerophosphate/cardiolipin synthase-like enzyme